MATTAERTVAHCPMLPSRSRDRSRWSRHDRAPWMRRRLRYELPRLLMPSRVVLPPVEYSRGTRPSQAAMSRALRNCRPRPAAASRAVAESGPMPGTVIRRRAVSSAAATASISPVTSLIRASRFLTSSNSSVSKRRIAGLRSFSSSATTRGRSALNFRPPVHRDPVLEAKGAHLADHTRALSDEAIADAVKRLQVDLLR